MQKHLVELASFAFVLGTFQCHAQRWTPSEEVIRETEARLQVQLAQGGSHGIQPLSSYVRYYTGETVDGEKVMLGELVTPLGSNQHPKTVVVSSRKEFPIIMDGGCSVVNLKYSIAKKQVVSLTCNGLA